MAVAGGPNIVEDGLVLALDAANKKSYPGSGTVWSDLASKTDYTIGLRLNYDQNNPGTFAMTQGGYGNGATTSTFTTNSTTCTCVFWIKTIDDQALFWGGASGANYVGAYRVAKKEYYSNCGSPIYYQDLEEKDNIYDHIRDGEWHMVEFKNTNLSTWPASTNYFNSYSNYQFNNGSIGQILIYDKNLTAAESLQNYNATKGRFGL